MRTFLCLVAFLAHGARSARALRVAFVADTGIGNDSPGREWTDWYGNLRKPSYKVDGVECAKFDSSYCGDYSRARDVFRLAREAKADLIVHAGDLDYVSSPESWLRFLTEHALRQGVGYVATKGNHDVDGWDGVENLWSGPRGYQALLSRQIPRGAKTYGSYGEDFSMTIGNTLFVLSSVGSERPGESANAEHYEFLERALSSSEATWKICVWHMTQNAMQSSYKGDATGFGAYEICRKHGAFIVTGHSHVYSRSYTMKRFGTKVYGYTREDLQVSDRDKRTIRLRAGGGATTGVAVVGVGGYKNEAQLTDSGIWAKVYSTSCQRTDSTCERARDANKYGLLLCDFPEDISSRAASCALRVVPRRGASDAAFRARARDADTVIDAFTLER